MAFWKTKAYNLLESDIRYAMQNSVSNKDAARFLKIGGRTYKRYAEMYIDAETGLDLYQLHRSKKAGRPRGARSWHCDVSENGEVMLGGAVSEGARTLAKALIHNGLKKEECADCGFDSRRITDYTVPLILIYLDGDKKNTRLENLKFLCFNCHYLTIGKVHGSYHIR